MERSKAIYKIRPDGHRNILSIKAGLYFDETKWDGNELFTVDELPGGCLATERVVKAMKKAKIANFQYEPLAEYCFLKNYESLDNTEIKGYI